MATSRVVVLVCDNCQAEGEGVATHAVTVDGRAAEVEACSRCWGRAEKGPLLALVSKGRKVRRKK